MSQQRSNLSGGRVILGVGAGWSTVEFNGYSEWLGTKSRVDKTMEALDIITRLWTEDSVSHKSKYYTIEEAVLEPKPVQKPYPKLLFGSSGKRMLRLTGRMGDYCYIPPWQMQNAAEMKETVLDAAEKAGRTPPCIVEKSYIRPPRACLRRHTQHGSLPQT